MVMRGKANLELAIRGKLLTRTALLPFGCEEVKIKHGVEEDKSTGRLVVPKFTEETRNEEQGPSGFGRNQKGDDKEGEDRRPEEPMEQNHDQAGKDDDKASTVGVSSLDFHFLDDYEIGTETLKGTTEPAKDEASTLEPPSAFMNLSRNLPESSSPGKFKTNGMKLLMESPRRRRKEGAARVPFLGTLPEEEWEVQCYGTQSMLETGPNKPLMLDILDKLDECEGRLSELLIDSATDESEVNSPIKATQQQGNNEVVYLSRTRKGTVRSKIVIDKINDMKMKMGSKVTLGKTGKTKKDPEISAKAVNSAKRKRVEEAIDMWQGDDQLLGTDRTLTDVMMVPPTLMAGLRPAS